jgi:hypothetical protein
MKKPFSTYRFTILLALIVSLLGAVCYSPLLLKKKKHTITKQNDSKSQDQHTQELNIAQHVLSTFSFSLYPTPGLAGDVFEHTYFGLPFEVVRKIHTTLFRSSYLENIFPFAISAQAP